MSKPNNSTLVTGSKPKSKSSESWKHQLSYAQELRDSKDYFNAMKAISSAFEKWEKTYLVPDEVNQDNNNNNSTSLSLSQSLSSTSNSNNLNESKVKLSLTSSPQKRNKQLAARISPTKAQGPAGASAQTGSITTSSVTQPPGPRLLTVAALLEHASQKFAHESQNKIRDVIQEICRHIDSQSIMSMSQEELDSSEEFVMGNLGIVSQNKGLMLTDPTAFCNKVLLPIWSELGNILTSNSISLTSESSDTNSITGNGNGIGMNESERISDDGNDPDDNLPDASNVIGDREITTSTALALSQGSSSSSSSSHTATAASKLSRNRISRTASTIISIMRKEITSLYLTRASILECLCAHARARVEYQAILSVLFVGGKFVDNASMGNQSESDSGQQALEDDNNDSNFNISGLEKGSDLKRFVLEKLMECDEKVRKLMECDEKIRQSAQQNKNRSSTSTTSSTNPSSSSSSSKKIPVTILTGFLGAGKTTLLNKILKDLRENSNTNQNVNDRPRVAVIENEFGEVGVDDGLIEQSKNKSSNNSNYNSKEDFGPEEIIEMNNGCICCTVRGDLIRGLKNLLGRGKKLDSVIIETTGLADPAPVAQSFFVDPTVQRSFQLDSIITVVDAYHLLPHLDDQNIPEGVENESYEQLVFADRIIVNKLDLIGVPVGSSGQQLKMLEELGASQILKTGEEVEDDEKKVIKDYTKSDPVSDAQIVQGFKNHNLVSSPTTVDGIGSSDPTSLTTSDSSSSKESPLVRYQLLRRRIRQVNPIAKIIPSIRFQNLNVHEDLLNLNAFQLDRVLELDPEFLHSDPDDGNDHLHDTSITSVGIQFLGDLHLDKLNFFLHNLLKHHGINLFRTKGIVAVHGSKKKFIFQGIHMLLEAKESDQFWEGDLEMNSSMRENKVVFIGRDIEKMREELNKGMKGCLAKEVLSDNQCHSYSTTVESYPESDPYGNTNAVDACDVGKSGLGCVLSPRRIGTNGNKTTKIDLDYLDEDDILL